MVGSQRRSAFDALQQGHPSDHCRILPTDTAYHARALRLYPFGYCVDFGEGTMGYSRTRRPDHAMRNLDCVVEKGNPVVVLRPRQKRGEIADRPFKRHDGRCRRSGPGYRPKYVYDPGDYGLCAFRWSLGGGNAERSPIDVHQGSRDVDGTAR